MSVEGREKVMSESETDREKMYEKGDLRRRVKEESS